MKKSSKRLTISSEAKNADGFHVRTNGIELSEFLANPLLLWMHKRPKGENNELLPLGYWEDIESKDGKISGVPVFDDTDDFAMKIFNKVENGTLKMASAGLKPNEFAQLHEDKWLEKSVLKEASIVDIGSNKECLAVALYNDSDELVTLAEIFEQLNPKKTDMKIIGLNAPTLALLKLAEGATEEAANKAVEELVTLAETQKTTIQTLTDGKKAAEDKLEAAVKLADSEKRIALADKAVADRKITADQKPFIIGLAEKDFEGTEKYLQSIKAAPTVKDSIGLAADADDGLLKLTYDELDRTNKLITLKEQNPEAFKEKFKKKFNKEYQG